MKKCLLSSCVHAGLVHQVGGKFSSPNCRPQPEPEPVSYCTAQLDNCFSVCLFAEETETGPL